MFTLKIKTSGAAFAGPAEPDDYYRALEIKRLLKEIGESVMDARTSGTVVDINGQSVGSWKLT